jgi:protease-4
VGRLRSPGARILTIISCDARTFAEALYFLRRRWGMHGRFSRWLSYLGGFTLAILVLCVAGAMIGYYRRGNVPSRTILEIDLDKKLVEVTAHDPLGRALQKDSVGLREVLDALERGSHDARVAGLVARIGAAPVGMAHIQELRDAVLAFRKSGRFAVAFSDTFGEFGPGNGSYYLATAFEQIYLQPSGDVGLTGLAASSPFVRGTLDKLGVVPRMDHRYEYKTAMNLFTETKFTPAHKEALKMVLDAQYGQLVRGIAVGRKLDEAAVRHLIDKGPYLGKEALDAKLVDGLGYRDEIYAKVKARVGLGAELLYVEKYLERAFTLA